jgi:hypothetical protein
MKKRSTRIITAERVAQKLHWPVEKWPGNCYAVALAMLEKGIAKGEPRYGHWLGPVEPGTMFYEKGRVVRHGWIETHNKHVIDPTRWVFEGKEPYIYQAPDFEGWYDAGGNVFRESTHGHRPVPAFSHAGGWFDSPPDLRPHLRALMAPVPCLKVSRDQLAWLANRPLPRLGAHARPVFRWILELKLGALIPMDNREMVLGRVVGHRARKEAAWETGTGR